MTETDAEFVERIYYSSDMIKPDEMDRLFALARRGAAVQSAFTLSSEAYERLVTILDNPAPPTEALKKLFRDYGPFLEPISPPEKDTHP